MALECADVTPRTVLLSIGVILWIGAMGCWLRARGRGLGRRAGEAALFIALGLPFLVAGAFYSASSYPGVALPLSTPPLIAVAATPEPAPTPAPLARATPPPPHAAAVLAAQRAAVARYPSLGIAETPFNRAFLAAYRRIQRTEPDYFDDPQWPLRLADEVASELAAE
jgi:hypothetical protein